VWWPKSKEFMSGNMVFLKSWRNHWLKRESLRFPENRGDLGVVVAQEGENDHWWTEIPT
jgi:hypothetical protein